MWDRHCSVSPQVDPVDQEGIQDYFGPYLDQKKKNYNESQCVVVSLELFIVVVVKVEKTVACFSLFYHGFKLLLSFSLLKSKTWTPWKYKKRLLD